MPRQKSKKISGRDKAHFDAIVRSIPYPQRALWEKITEPTEKQYAALKDANVYASLTIPRQHAAFKEPEKKSVRDMSGRRTRSTGPATWGTLSETKKLIGREEKGVPPPPPKKKKGGGSPLGKYETYTGPEPSVPKRESFIGPPPEYGVTPKAPPVPGPNQPKSGMGPAHLVGLSEEFRKNLYRGWTAERLQKHGIDMPMMPYDEFLENLEEEEEYGSKWEREKEEEEEEVAKLIEQTLLKLRERQMKYEPEPVGSVPPEKSAEEVANEASGGYGFVKPSAPPPESTPPRKSAPPLEAAESESEPGAAPPLETPGGTIVPVTPESKYGGEAYRPRRVIWGSSPGSMFNYPIGFEEEEEDDPMERSWREITGRYEDPGAPPYFREGYVPPQRRINERGKAAAGLGAAAAVAATAAAAYKGYKYLKKKRGAKEVEVPPENLPDSKADKPVNNEGDGDGDGVPEGQPADADNAPTFEQPAPTSLDSRTNKRFSGPWGTYDVNSNTAPPGWKKEWVVKLRNMGSDEVAKRNFLAKFYGADKVEMGLAYMQALESGWYADKVEKGGEMPDESKMPPDEDNLPLEDAKQEAETLDDGFGKEKEQSQFTREAINIENSDKVVPTTASGLKTSQGIIFNVGATENVNGGEIDNAGSDLIPLHKAALTSILRSDEAAPFSRNDHMDCMYIEGARTGVVGLEQSFGAHLRKNNPLSKMTPSELMRVMPGQFIPQGWVSSMNKKRVTKRDKAGLDLMNLYNKTFYSYSGQKPSLGQQSQLQNGAHFEAGANPGEQGPLAGMGAGGADAKNTQGAGGRGVYGAAGGPMRSSLQTDPSIDPRKRGKDNDGNVAYLTNDAVSAKDWDLMLQPVPDTAKLDRAMEIDRQIANRLSGAYDYEKNPSMYTVLEEAGQVYSHSGAMQGGLIPDTRGISVDGKLIQRVNEWNEPEQMTQSEYEHLLDKNRYYNSMQGKKDMTDDELKESLLDGIATDDINVAGGTIEATTAMMKAAQRKRKRRMEEHTMMIKTLYDPKRTKVDDLGGVTGDVVQYKSNAKGGVGGARSWYDGVEGLNPANEGLTADVGSGYLKNPVGQVKILPHSSYNVSAQKIDRLQVGSGVSSLPLELNKTVAPGQANLGVDPTGDLPMAWGANQLWDFGGPSLYNTGVENFNIVDTKTERTFLGNEASSGMEGTTAPTQGLIREDLVLNRETGTFTFGRNTLQSGIDDVIAEAFSIHTEKPEWRQADDIMRKKEKLQDSKTGRLRHPDGTFYHSEDWYEQDAKEASKQQRNNDYFGNEGEFKRDIIGEFGVVNNDESISAQLRRGNFAKAALMELGNASSKLTYTLANMNNDAQRIKYLRTIIPNLSIPEANALLIRFHAGKFSSDDVLTAGDIQLATTDMAVGGENAEDIADLMGDAMEQQADEEEDDDIDTDVNTSSGYIPGRHSGDSFGIANLLGGGSSHGNF